MSAPQVIIAAGGTGGHMFPAQALAEALLDKGWQVQLSTDARGARYAGGFPAAVTVRVTGSATFARGGILQKLLVPLRIAGGVTTAIWRMLRRRPQVVVGFGGYPTIPAMAAAWLLRVPRMIHEQNGVLGRVNQLFARRVDQIACSVWPTRLPRGVTGTHTGNPVRAAVLRQAGSPYIPPGDYPMSLVVLGGSQGARIMSEIVPPAIAALPEHLRSNIRVSHQARPEDLARVTEYYESELIRADVAPFFEDVPRRMADAQLIISRSGASTVADASVIGRPAIWVPFAAARRDEQTANAQALIAAGAGVLMSEAEFEVPALTAKLTELLSDQAGTEKMADAALAASMPDATARLVEMVETLAQAGKR